MKKILWYSLFMIWSVATTAQTDSVEVCFSSHLALDQLAEEQLPYHFKANEISINTLKYYISKVSFSYQNAIVFEEENSFHLIDKSDEKTARFMLLKPTNLLYDQINFTLGIDSTTNVSGALGGDLDPTKGMYWAWHSGYINFKLEGVSPDCPNRNNEFQYHLGGYMSPFLNKQDISLTCKPQETIFIGLDLGRFVAAIDWSEGSKIMSPSEKAVALAEFVQTLFFIYEEN